MVVFKKISLTIKFGIAIIFGFGSHTTIMADNTLGNIKFGVWGFCPRGTLPAQGNALPADMHSSLKALLGSLYALPGDSDEIVRLPDFRGRSPAGPGSRDSMQFSLGNKIGSDVAPLTIDATRPHNHAMKSSKKAGEKNPAVDQSFAKKTKKDAYVSETSAGDVTKTRKMPDALEKTTEPTPEFYSRSPYHVVDICIVVEGIFPAGDIK